jgi:hypothetical protein
VRIVVVVLLLLASIAHADRLDEAKRLEAQLEFEPALAIVEQLITKGGNDRAQLVELHLFAGKLAAGLDRRDVAEDHFARVLSLAPSTKLPEGISPKIAMPFEAARIRSGPLVISEDGRVESDPLNLVASVRKANGLVAYDVYGNVVWTEPYEPIQDGTDIVAPRTVVRKSKRTASFIGLTLLTYVGTGLAMWRFNHAQNEWNDMKSSDMANYTELQSVEQRGRRWSYAANAGIAASIAMTLVTVSVAW